LIVLLFSRCPLLRFGVSAFLSATRFILGLISLGLCLSSTFVSFLLLTIYARLFLAANRSYSRLLGGLNCLTGNGTDRLLILIAAVIVLGLVEKHFGAFQNLWCVLRRLRVARNADCIASF